MSAADVVVPIATAVIGVAAGGAGGAWLAGRNEHKHWLRQQRMDAYSGLLEVLLPSKPPTTQDEEFVAKYHNQMLRASSRVLIAGPRQVADIVGELSGDAMDLAEDPEHFTRINELTRGVERYIEACRRALN